MADDRFILAIGRLERALSRIESVRQPPPTPPTLALAEDQVSTAVHQRLHERNAQLRRQVEQAVRRIDVLLAADEAA
jgi:hypothetical protein